MSCCQFPQFQSVVEDCQIQDDVTDTSSTTAGTSSPPCSGRSGGGRAGRVGGVGGRGVATPETFVGGTLEVEKGPGGGEKLGECTRDIA